MLKRILLVLAVSAALFAGSVPANATECTPKGCTGGCRLNPNVQVDPESGTVILEQPLECYS